MFKKWTNCFLKIAFVVFISWTFESTAGAANCGGNVPCHCGDSLVANRKLVLGVDAVVDNPCTGNGLVLNVPGVALDLNGNKIQGSGTGVGILINANNVTIENGKVDRFGTGIATASPTTGSVINSVKTLNCTGDGILLEGDSNELTAILAKTNGNNGVTVRGDSNVLSEHNDEYNGFHGIFVEGNQNQLLANLASENRKKGPGNGITIVGNNNFLELNRMTKQNTNGISVMGSNNTLTENKATKQDNIGITVNGNDNVLTDSKAVDNKGIGIIVEGAGDPNDSSGNVVQNNRGTPQCRIYGVTAPPICIQN